MRYEYIPQQIPQERRQEINEKILFAIDTGKDALPPETIYNCYSGLGGLHSLHQSDFPSYNDYAQAKREFEMGQFFTPHEICRQMVELVAPEPSEMVLEMCCGIGNFLNHLPNLFNTYGFDIDPNAVKVARHLYPEANIEHCDLLRYDPEQRFDVVIGNPPFNLDMDGSPSQFVYMNKAYWMLNPGGVLAVIVPQTFLQDATWHKTRINAVDRDFSFVGQSPLDPNAFAALGVKDFGTKVMVFTKRSEHIESVPINTEEFVSFAELGSRVRTLRARKHELRLKLRRETNTENTEEEAAFQCRLKKYLFELKAHPHLRVHYDQAVALVTKYRNQKPPENCTREQYKEWEKRKLTPAKVLAVLRRYIRNQYVVPRREVALVRTSYSYKLKAYAPRMLDGIEHRETKLYNLTINNGGLPQYPDMTPKLRAHYASAVKVISRKHRAYLHQSKEFATMERDAKLDAAIESLTFLNKPLDTIRYLPLQKHDMGLAYQKDYALLNWQQGSGKTAVAYHFGLRLLEQGRVKNIIVTAPAIAVNLTWIPFLRRNGQPFVVVKHRRDVEHIPRGAFVVVSNSMLGKLKRPLMEFVKRGSRKFCLLFDESDELTNPYSKRTRYTLDIFRRLRFKMPLTGTITRNNIGELYSQLELMYNNSVNMMCWCRTKYFENKDKQIVSEPNDGYGKPFPARGGAVLFKACHCPGKATVFGLEKQNQDIYNKEQLWDLIGKSIITREFREFAGDKYEIVNHTVGPSEGERAVYRIIMEKFLEIAHQHFNPIKDRRKESQFRILRQIQLLIKACSIPNTFSGYHGERYPTKALKIAKLIRRMPGQVAVGCTTREGLEVYESFLAERFPERSLFVIHGDVSFDRREKIIDRFEASGNGILVCTQQSLKSSANIPLCDNVILESLLWNIPRMEQFYFRFIRLDSPRETVVHFITYEESIEQNLMALLMTKERLNEFIKNGEVTQESEIFEEFDVSPSILGSLLYRTQDEKGTFHICWGDQNISA